MYSLQSLPILGRARDTAGYTRGLRIDAAAVIGSLVLIVPITVVSIVTAICSRKVVRIKYVILQYALIMVWVSFEQFYPPIQLYYSTLRPLSGFAGRFGPLINYIDYGIVVNSQHKYYIYLVYISCAWI